MRDQELPGSAAQTPRLRLERADFRNADARLTTISGADLRNADLQGGNFSYATLRHCDLSGANLTNACFDNAELVAANLEGCVLQNTSFIGAQLLHPTLGPASFQECDFSKARFFGVNFKSVNFTNCNFDGALFEKTRFEATAVLGCTFSRANFESTHFASTTIVNSVFSHASFTKPHLNKCNLEDLSLANADISFAIFEECILSRVSLVGTSIADCDFNHSTLESLDLVGTSFSNLDLTVFLQCSPRRLGVCSIDYSSIARTVVAHPADSFRWQPYQKLQEFLENCGMPSLAALYVVDAARSLTQKEIWSLMQSTFISYGSPDENFASRLTADLSRSGVQTFFFPLDAEFGEKLHVTMKKVNEYDRTILVCSRESLVRKGVQYEIEKVVEREAREGGTSLLIPVAIDDYLFSEWQPERPSLKQEVLNRVVADFRDINDYRAQFNRLLKALRKPDSRPELLS